MTIRLVCRSTGREAEIQVRESEIGITQYRKPSKGGPYSGTRAMIYGFYPLSDADRRMLIYALGGVVNEVPGGDR